MDLETLPACLVNYLKLECLRKLAPVNKRLKYEFNNAVDRLMLSLCLYKTSKINPIPKFLSELDDKKIVYSKDELFNALRKDHLPQNFKVDNMSRCGKYNTWIVNIQISNYGLIFATQKLSADKITWLREFKKNDIAELLLRYITIGNRSQQWSVPKAQFAHLKSYSVTNEGFASPLNNSYTNYCSLFESDKKFGSMGSFFDAKLEGGWLINPPFIESVMQMTSQKVLDAIENPSTFKCFVIVLPDWGDMKAYQMLSNSPKLRYKEILQKEKHYYEHNGKKQIARFRSAIFVFDTRGSGSGYYKNLTKCMKC